MKISKEKVPGRKKWAQLLGLDLNDNPLFRDKETIDSIAIKLRSLISRYKLHCVVVGYPCSIKNENPYGEQVKIFINDLHNTGKLEGLKYTYWDKRFASKAMESDLKTYFNSADHCNHILVRHSGDEVLRFVLPPPNSNDKAALSPVIELCDGEDPSSTVNSIADVSEKIHHRYMQWFFSIADGTTIGVDVFH
ncbi:hypothetical protein Q3G72_025778 [Acer saccharum]|nr:hypothetical protein Q3G72_025778 [Acer saccharum]